MHGARRVGSVMKSTIIASCLFTIALMGGTANAGNVLISAEEAALPPASGTKIPMTTRAITRRPDVVLVSPGSAVTSPFNLQFKFQAHGGSTIKPASFHLIYLKDPAVDLTARVKPYVSANGVE